MQQPLCRVSASVSLSLGGTPVTCDLAGLHLLSLTKAMPGTFLPSGSELIFTPHPSELLAALPRPALCPRLAPMHHVEGIHAPWLLLRRVWWDWEGVRKGARRTVAGGLFLPTGMPGHDRAPPR